jgi:glycosyltransferase involved in cell wall biosynthesis
MQPLLSVCIPTWNRANYLNTTLSSLAAANSNLPEGAIELCLSDNCSTDSTSAVIFQAFKLGIPLRTLRLARKAEFSVNYWSAASLATGRYTWITGDDDAFCAKGLSALLCALSSLSRDFLLINSAPWKVETNLLADQEIYGLEAYFGTLGVFHASFIGNSIFATELLRPFIGHTATLGSAYPQMAPVFGLLRNGNCRFLNICPVTTDDSGRMWRARQPLLTSIDMARIVTDLALFDPVCCLSTRVEIYAVLVRSLPSFDRTHHS